MGNMAIDNSVAFFENKRSSKQSCLTIMSLRENALNIYTSCLEKLEPRKRVYDYLLSLKTSIVDCDKIFQ